MIYVMIAAGCFFAGFIIGVIVAAAKKVNMHDDLLNDLAKQVADRDNKLKELEPELQRVSLNSIIAAGIIERLQTDLSEAITRLRKYYDWNDDRGAFGDDIRDFLNQVGSNVGVRS